MAVRPKLTAAELQALGGSIPVSQVYTKQEDGTFLLDVPTENGLELSDVTPLRNALGHKKDELDAARSERDSLKSKLDAANSELTTLRSDKGAGKLEDLVKAEVSTIREKLEQDVANIQAELDKKDILVKKHVLEASAMGAIVAAGGNPDVLMPHVLRRLRVDEVDGELKVVPLQADGKSPYISSKSGSTDVGTLEELVSGPEFKTSKTFAMCFKADNPDGGVGTNPGSGKPAGGAPPVEIDHNKPSNPGQRLADIRRSNGTGKRPGTNQPGVMQ